MGRMESRSFLAVVITLAALAQADDGGDDAPERPPLPPAAVAPATPDGPQDLTILVEGGASTAVAPATPDGPQFFDPPRSNPYPDKRAVVYAVRDVLDALAKQHQVDAETARQLLVYELRRGQRGDTGVFRWNDDRLVAVAGEPGHESLAERLEVLRGQLFDELQITACVAEAPSVEVAHLELAWRVTPAERSEEFAPGELDSARGVVARRQPLKWAVLTPQQSREVEMQLNTPRLRVLGRPAVRLFSGRPAMVEANRQRPFVVEVVDGTPRIETFDDGWKLRLQPDAREQEVVLHGELTLSRVLDVETVRSGTKRLQIPEVELRMLQWTVNVPMHHTLIVSGLRQQRSETSGEGHDDAYVETVVLLRPSRVGEPLPSAGGDIESAVSLETRIYEVGDLLTAEGADAARRLGELAELLSAATRRGSQQAKVEIDPQRRALVVRQTAAGHRRVGQLLDHLRSLTPDTSLEVRTIEAPISQLARAGLGGRPHAVVDSEKVEQLIETSLTPAREARPADGPDRWQLSDGSIVTASAEPLGGGLLMRMTAGHHRDETVTVECRRELTAGAHLVLDISPAPALEHVPLLGKTIRTALGEPARKLVIISPRAK